MALNILIRRLRWMFKIQLIGYLLKEAFVDKINENLVKTEEASKHVIEKIEVDDEKTVGI